MSNDKTERQTPVFNTPPAEKTAEKPAPKAAGNGRPPRSVGGK